MKESEILSKLAKSVEEGEPEDAAALAQQALDEGLDPLMAINEGLTPGITRVGESFSCGDAYLPDLILGGEAMKSALAILEPALLENQEREVTGRVVLGTVKRACLTGLHHYRQSPHFCGDICTYPELHITPFSGKVDY